MTATTDTRAQASGPHAWLQLALLVAAILELLTSLPHVPVLFDDDPEIPGTSPGGLVISATIVLVPLFAIAAIWFAARREIPGAAICVAAVALLKWLSFVPSPDPFWDFPGGPMGGLMVVQMTVLPLLALAAIYLAWRKERLALATIFAVIPTLFDVLGIAAFAIGVMIYGF